VWEAYDRDRNAVLALKTLTRSDPGALYRFKNEFRSLTELAHPNLVQLHELFADRDDWFFTMELVDGVGAEAYVRGARGGVPHGSGPVSPALGSDGAAVDVGGSTQQAVLPLPTTPASSPTPPPAPTPVTARMPALGPRPVATPTPGPALTSNPVPAATRASASAAAATPIAALPPIAFTADETRLRSLYGQLAEGLSFLHQSGRLHRDVKPSNVMVTPDGRAVLLDFGLVTGAADDDEHPGAVSGTPHYMAPEQAAGERVTEAADWYAVGVMLYQSLSGKLPFDGSAAETMTAKRVGAAPPIGDRVIGAPDDLVQLAMALLSRSPGERPVGREVLARLSSGQKALAPREALARREASAPREAALVGRLGHRVALQAAFDALVAGRPQVVLLHGSSGMGKSTLLARFAADLRGGAGAGPSPGLSPKSSVSRSSSASTPAVILSGRCFEQESVPYKTLDGLVDALAHHLGRLPAGEAAVLLPADVGMLSRLFPVLRQVRGVNSAADAVTTMTAASAPSATSATSNSSLDDTDTVALRRRAVAAMRELLVRLGGRIPLVLLIDDLQWGDADGAALLAEILRPPDPPRVLLVAAYRDDDAERSECLRVLLPALRAAATLAGTLDTVVATTVVPVAAAAPVSAAVFDLRDVAVERLSSDEALDLARAALAEQGGTVSPARAEAIARESEGWPFFIRELARFSESGASRETSSLEAMLSARVAGLGPEARRFLEVVAIHGQPIERAVAASAAQLDDEPAAVGVLLRNGLLRARAGHRSTEVESYHDRVRETVAASVTGETRRAYHERLASALAATGSADAETLAAHYRGAGDTVKAIACSVRAADKAVEALAFARAATLYRRALELVPPEQAPPLRARLADALADAGRGREAADAYLAAIPGADPAQVFRLRRRATEQYLRSGHLDEGFAAAREVLAAVDLRLPSETAGSLASLMWRRLRLGIQGLDVRPRAAGDVASTEELTRIDVCWSIGNGLGGVNPLRGAAFQAQHLLLALKAGEPFRAVRALAWESILSAIQGKASGHARALDLLQRARAAAGSIDNPHAHAWLLAADSIAIAHKARWRESQKLAADAMARFRERSVDIAWEIGSLQVWWWLPPFYFLGELGELERAAAPCVKEAEEHGDLYTVTSLKTYVTPVVWLAQDRPEEAHRELTDAMSLWKAKGWQLQHWSELLWRTQTELYAGDYAAAWKRMDESWARYNRTLFSFTQLNRLQTTQLHARAALAALAAANAGPGLGASSSEARRLIKLVESDAARLAREDLTFSDAYVDLLRAALAVQQHRPDEALPLLDSAAAGFRELEMALHAAATDRRRGEIVGGDEGRATIARADAALAACHARNPARMTDMLAPGFTTR
jgi:hypothetical protein